MHLQTPLINFKRYWISALLGAATDFATTSMTNSANRKLQRESQAWQTSEREASQAYQTSEREAQNKWGERMYNQYQSPLALAKQYAEAGLNPALASGAGNVGSPTSGAGSSGGAPSAPGTSVGWQQPFSVSESVGSMANAAKAFAEAEKTGLDSKLLRETFDDLAADTKYSMHMKKFEALVGQYVRNEKDLALIKEIGQKIKTGVATEDQIHELIKGIKIKNASDRNALFKWFETYNRDARAIEAGIANTTANTDRTYVGSLLDAQKILESRSVVDVNRQNARKIGLDADLLEDTFDDIKTELKTKIAGMESDNRNKVIQTYDSLIGVLNYALSGQHEISGDHYQRLRELFDFRGTRKDWIPFLLKHADSIEALRESLGVVGFQAGSGTYDQDGRRKYPLKPIE